MLGAAGCGDGATGGAVHALEVEQLAAEQRGVGEILGNAEFAVFELDGKAVQQVVEVGSKQGGMVEITKGLQGGEKIALDGAGFLTNGAAVAVKEAAKPTGAGTAAPVQPAGK